MELDDSNWSMIQGFFPKDWELKVSEFGAVRRRFRNFKNVGDFLRTLLLHVGKGYSLKETAAIVSETAIDSISGYGISKGLIRSEGWLHYLCRSLLCSSDERLLILQEVNSSFNMRLIDGSIVKESGKTGSQWRIHYIPNTSPNSIAEAPGENSHSYYIKY